MSIIIYVTYIVYLHTHCIWPFGVFHCVFWYGWRKAQPGAPPTGSFRFKVHFVGKNDKLPHYVVDKTGVIPFWLVHKNLSEGLDVEPLDKPLDIPRSTDLWGFLELSSHVIWYEPNTCPCVLLVSFNDRNRSCHAQRKFGRQRTWNVWL